jgi:hypothetical protein
MPPFLKCLALVNPAFGGPRSGIQPGWWEAAALFSIYQWGKPEISLAGECSGGRTRQQISG